MAPLKNRSNWTNLSIMVLQSGGGEEDMTRLWFLQRLMRHGGD
jgi:hypothetical protein